MIRQTVGRFPNGTTTDEIKSTANLNLELRTLQRRLELLVEMDDLTLSGSKRTAKYYPINAQAVSLITAEKKAKPSNENIPLSKESIDILNILSEPIDQRKPVLYNREFADKYRPDIDF